MIVLQKTRKKQKNISDYYIEVFNTLKNTLQQIENTENSNEKTKLDLDKFSSLLKRLDGQFTTNRERLNSTLKEPSRSIKLTFANELIDDTTQLIDTANIAIQKHNNIVGNYSNEKNKLVNEIWKFIIYHNHTLIDNFFKKKKT